MGIQKLCSNPIRKATKNQPSRLSSEIERASVI